MLNGVKNHFPKNFSFQQAQLLSGSAIMIFGSFATSFINYLYHLIMGRILEPANYGILASVISLVGLLVLLPNSMGLVVTKLIAKAKNEKEVSEKVATLNKNVLWLGVVSFSALVLLSPFIAQFIKVEKFLIIIGLLVFLLSFPLMMFRGTLQGLLKFKEMVISQTVENLLRLLVAVVLVLVGFSIGGALFGLVLGVLVGFIIAWLFVKSFLSLSKGRQKLSVNILSTVNQILPFFLLSISITSLYSSDLILVKHFFGSFEAGIYGAMSFLGRIIFFGVSPITAVMFPIVAKNYSKGQSGLVTLKWSLLGAFLIALFINSIYAFLPELVIKQLYGEKYLLSTSLLVFFGIFITFVTLSFLLLNYGLAQGQSRIVLASFLAASLQITFIWIYHPTLFAIILISIIISFVLFLYLVFYTFRQSLGLKQ